VRARHTRLRTILFLSVAVLSTGLGLLLYATDALHDPELDTVDARFSIRGTDKAPSDLVVVKIDDKTFDELRQQWPFRRITHAHLIDRIAADKPKVIAYDVQFSERSTDHPSDDEYLAGSIGNAGGRVVLATTEVNEKGEGNFLGTGQDFLVKDLHGRFGSGQLPSDPGDVYRRVDYEVAGMKTFAVAAVETATGRKVDPGQFGGDPAWIDYRGPPDTLRSVSFGDVLEKKVPRGFFHDKLVVVGPYATSLQDLHPTSTTGTDEQMSGAEIQANAIDTVRRGLPLESAPGALDVAMIVLLGLVAPVGSLVLSPQRSLAIAVALGVLFTVGAQLAFNNGLIVSFIYPLGTLLLSAVGALAVHLITTAFERERVRDMFSRFVPENVVEETLQRTDDDLRLGGVERQATVMFTDLRGFTSFAESMPPDQVIEVLNQYLSDMSDAILDHGGTLVAYMGDGIMAVFGAPIEQEDHADRALSAAREMLYVRLERFNDWLRARGLSEDGFRMGIGLNSGQVMSGNVGSARRLEYTAIGDTTNTASRIEGMTKGTPHQLFVADSTQQALIDAPEDLVFVDEFEVRGREARIKLWTLEDGALSSQPQARAQTAPGSGSSGRPPL
jgi:adenylate cyclase